MATGEPRAVSNPDLYAYALFRLGSTGRFVDIEDIYVECWIYRRRALVGGNTTTRTTSMERARAEISRELTQI